MQRFQSLAGVSFHSRYASATRLERCVVVFLDVDEPSRVESLIARDVKIEPGSTEEPDDQSGAAFALGYTLR